MNIFHNKLIKTISIVITIICVCVNTTKAQQHDTVNVIAPYTPTISDAFKINQNPIISDTIKPITITTYTTYPKMFKTYFNVSPIKPAKLVDEKIIKLYKSLLKVGFGTLITPYTEIFFNNLRSKSFLFTAHFNHLSSAEPIKGYGNSSFSDNVLDIGGKKFVKNHTLSFGGDYSRNVMHYYGFKLNDYPYSSSKDDIKQRFTLLSGNAKIQSNYTDSSMLHHRAGLSYNYLNDFYHATENNINFSAGISKNVKIIKNTKRQLFELTADADYYNYKFAVNPINTYLVKLVPHYKVILDEYTFNIGLNTSVVGDSLAKLYLYPLADVSINLVKDMFIVYSGLGAEVQKNSFKLLADENPFIRSNVPMDFSYKKFEFIAGLKGNLSSNITFNLAYIGSQIDNMALFVTDTLLSLKNKFTVIYDDVDVSDIKAEFSYQKTDKFKLLFKADYYQYLSTHEIKAWHKPEMDVSLSFNYNIQSKIITRVDIFAYGKKYARTFNDKHQIECYKLNGIIDANLSVEYRYTKLLSAFIMLNNLGASKYYQWYNYPSRRFNVLLGVSHSF